MPASDGALDTELDPEAAEAEQQKAAQLYSKEDRIAAFQDLAYVNRFARNCPPASLMSQLSVAKFKFAGPDPPLEPPKKEEDEQQEEAKAAPKAAPKKGEEAAVEIELTEEEKAELVQFEAFADVFTPKVAQVQAELGEYRALVHPERGADKVALWPKTFSAKEIAAMRAAEEEKAKREEEEEAEKLRKQQEEEKAAPPKRGAPKKPD